MEAACADSSPGSSMRSATSPTSGDAASMDMSATSSSSSSEEDDDEEAAPSDGYDTEPRSDDDDGGAGGPPPSESSERDSHHDSGAESDELLETDDEGHGADSSGDSSAESDVVMVYEQPAERPAHRPAARPPAAPRPGALPRDFPPPPTPILRGLVGIAVDCAYDVTVGEERELVNGYGCVSIIYIILCNSFIIIKLSSLLGNAFNHLMYVNFYVSGAEPDGPREVAAPPS